MINKNKTRTLGYSSWRQEIVFEYGDCILIEKHELDILSKIESHRGNKIDTNDIVYFTKASKLPRFKYKEYIESKNINPKKTNRIDFANTFILSINELKSELGKKYEDYYVIPANDLISVAQSDVITYIRDNNITEMIIRKSSIDDYIDSGTFVISKTKMKTYPIKTYNKIHVGWGSGITESYIDICNYLESKLDKVKIILDESFTEVMNEGLIIDDEVYENIAMMLSSTDEKNVSMGMEIIANCDFVKSNVYILMLVNEFWRKFNSKNITPNFKNCLNYYKKYPFSVNWDSFVRTVIDELQSPEDKKAINKYIKRQLNTRHKGYFQIEEIKIKGLD